MDKQVQLGGVMWYIGEVRRDRSPLAEQLESLEESYEGFEWICVSCGKIRFYYKSKKG